MLPKCANFNSSVFLVAAVILPDLVMTMFAEVHIKIMSHAYRIAIILHKIVKETIPRSIEGTEYTRKFTIELQ